MSVLSIVCLALQFVAFIIHLAIQTGNWEKMSNLDKRLTLKEGKDIKLEKKLKYLQEDIRTTRFTFLIVAIVIAAIQLLTSLIITSLIEFIVAILSGGLFIILWAMINWKKGQGTIDHNKRFGQSKPI